MQILFKHPRPEHPFWRKKHSRQHLFALAVRLENHKNVVFRCASATFAHPKHHFRRVQVPFPSTLSATSTQYSQHEYWSLAARVLEFSSTSTLCKCYNSTCFYEITPQPIKYQHVVFFVLSAPPKTREKRAHNLFSDFPHTLERSNRQISCHGKRCATHARGK